MTDRPTGDLRRQTAAVASVVLVVLLGLLGYLWVQLREVGMSETGVIAFVVGTAVMTGLYGFLVRMMFVSAARGHDDMGARFGPPAAAGGKTGPDSKTQVQPGSRP